MLLADEQQCEESICGLFSQLHSTGKRATFFEIVLRKVLLRLANDKGVQATKGHARGCNNSITTTAGHNDNDSSCSEISDHVVSRVVHGPGDYVRKQELSQAPRS